MSLEKEYQVFDKNLNQYQEQSDDVHFISTHLNIDTNTNAKSNYFGENLKSINQDMNDYEAMKNDLIGLNGKEKDYDKWLGKKYFYWAPFLSAIIPALEMRDHANQLNSVPEVLMLMVGFVTILFACSLLSNLRLWRVLPLGWFWEKKKKALAQQIEECKEKIIQKYNNKESFYEAFWFADNIINLAGEKYGQEFAAYLKNTEGDEFWKNMRGDVEYVFTNFGNKKNKNVEATLWNVLLKINNRENWLENTFKQYQAEKNEQKIAQENALDMNDGYEKYLKHKGKKLPLRNINISEDQALNLLEQSIPDLKQIL
jgi:hypothetical protein